MNIGTEAKNIDIEVEDEKKGEEEVAGNHRILILLVYPSLERDTDKLS